MMRCLVIAGVILVAPPVASAGPTFAIGYDFTVGHGGEVEALDLGWRLEAGVFVRVGRWHAAVKVPWHPQITSARPQRDNPELTGLGVGGLLAYRAPMSGLGVLSIGGGITRRWVTGHAPTLRACRETGTCLAGTYMETPSYHAWAPQLRVSIGAETFPLPAVVGVSFDLIIEAIGLNDVPPAGIRDVTVMAGATFTIGIEPTR